MLYIFLLKIPTIKSQCPQTDNVIGSEYMEFHHESSFFFLLPRRLHAVLGARIPNTNDQIWSNQGSRGRVTAEIHFHIIYILLFLPKFIKLNFLYFKYMKVMFSWNKIQTAWYITCRHQVVETVIYRRKIIWVSTAKTNLYDLTIHMGGKN